MIDLTQVSKSVFVAVLEANLKGLREQDKAHRHFLSGACLHLGADAGWIYRDQPGIGLPQGQWVDGRDDLFDAEMSAKFLAQEAPPLPPTLLMVPLTLAGRPWGMLGFARDGEPFPRSAMNGARRLARMMMKEIERRDRVRTQRVLKRVRDKVVSKLRPRDLAYQILDGLYELVEYDHSAALLLYDADESKLQVEAEKVVWSKTPGPFIGRKIEFGAEHVRPLRRLNGHNLPLEPQADEPAINSALRGLLPYEERVDDPAPSNLMVHPLFHQDAFLGLLVMAGWRRDPFGERAQKMVRPFLSTAVVALRNVGVHRKLESQAIDAEQRASLVTLARAVAHDVNNAIGAILPLATQLREDVVTGQFELDEAKQDLDLIVDKAELCKRIFSNMVRLSDQRSPSRGPLDVNRAVKEVIPLLASYISPKRVTLKPKLQRNLTTIRFSRDHFHHILWNLVTNASDAMSKGGTIEITTRTVNDEALELVVTDDGPGIPEEVMEHVLEPFYTTKTQGTGLGLSLCRSLAWEYRGTIHVESDGKTGTTVTVRIPLATTAVEGGRS